jgi:hypothetical protein
MKTAVCLVAICLSQLSHAEGLVQDERLEAKLRKGDPKVLAMFPAAGFKNGVAGFVKRYGLYVAPDSAQAWCQDRQRGQLEPGCYVIMFLQVKGFKTQNSDGALCGSAARWYKAPGSATYVPIPWWPGMARNIAEGNSKFVLYVIKDDNRRFCE